MYWWSNIAVPETPDTRVLVPAVDTFINRFGDNHYVLDRNTIANALDGIDVSYSTRINRSIDFFFRIPREEKAVPVGSGWRRQELEQVPDRRQQRRLH